MMQALPPQSEQELLARANQLAGMTLAELACFLNEKTPNDLLYAKGWQGQLIEQALGADAGNKSMPDFSHLGIELKTIPINQDGSVRETTYICTVPLINTLGLTWNTSRIYQKLTKVLWIPLEAEPTLEISKRRIGMPLLWSPNARQENVLRTDWEELMELISLGKVDSITAHQGVALQIRPKAAHSQVKTVAIDEEGEKLQTLPRGFYLRTSFTTAILQESYLSGIT